MEVFLEIMKPLVEITEALGAQNWVTISTVRPLLHQLLNKLLKFEPTDTRLSKTMKEKMHLNLSHHYTGPTLDILNKAAFLDPRFKALQFLDSSERKEVFANIETEAATLTHESTDHLLNEEPPTPKLPRGEQLMYLLKDIVKDSSVVDIPISDRAAKEVTRYISEEEGVDCGPLKWWTSAHSRFPLLSQLAKKYLAVPATSVPSERAFSIAGHIVQERRSCLLPENINMLVFLSSNLK